MNADELVVSAPFCPFYLLSYAIAAGNMENLKREKKCARPDVVIQNKTEKIRNSRKHQQRTFDGPSIGKRIANDKHNDDDDDDATNKLPINALQRCVLCTEQCELRSFELWINAIRVILID